MVVALLFTQFSLPLVNQTLAATIEILQPQLSILNLVQPQAIGWFLGLLVSIGGQFILIQGSVGVPHIYGQTLPAMYYGFSYAQMENHATLLLRLHAQAGGAGGCVLGPALGRFKQDRDLVRHIPAGPAR